MSVAVVYFGNFNGVDPRWPRSPPRRFDNPINGIFSAVNHRFDAAVRAVADPAGAAMLERVVQNKLAKTYALHKSTYVQVSRNHIIDFLKRLFMGRIRSTRCRLRSLHVN
jgi:hypothetical protein